MSANADRPEERRREPRQGFNGCLVKIDLGPAQEAIVCFVWDISLRGARLKLSKCVELPKVVNVLIGDVRKEARIVWCNGDQIGIEFFARLEKL
jgi:hypothetical protein